VYFSANQAAVNPPKLEPMRITGMSGGGKAAATWFNCLVRVRWGKSPWLRSRILRLK